MKKIIMLAIIAIVSFTGISLIAGTTDDKTVKTEKKTERVVSENDNDLGPKVGRVRAKASASGRMKITKYFDIYCATNKCDSYVAYTDGDTRKNNPMTVFECNGNDCDGSYYVIYGGNRYYFDL